MLSSVIFFSFWFVAWFGIIIPLLWRMIFEWLLLRYLLLRWLFLRCYKLYKLLNKNMIFIASTWLLLTFILNKTPLGETGCLSNPYFLLKGCLGIQFFNLPFSQHSQLGYLWFPTSHCAALVWLMGHHVTLLVTSHFPCNPYLSKQRISLEVAKHPKHVHLLTYLVWLQPVIDNWIGI